MKPLRNAWAYVRDMAVLCWILWHEPEPRPWEDEE